jgi:hypothetical protein
VAARRDHGQAMFGHDDDDDDDDRMEWVEAGVEISYVLFISVNLAT